MALRKRRNAAQQTSNQQVVELVAAMATLEERMGNLISEFTREREGAATHRKELREVITALSESVRTVSAAVASLTATVSEMKPVVADYSTRRAEEAGALKLAGFLRWLVHAGWLIGGFAIAKFAPALMQ